MGEQIIQREGAKARRREEFQGFSVRVAVILDHLSDDGQMIFSPLRLRAFALKNRLYCRMEIRSHGL